jgi:hypothetical protein
MATAQTPSIGGTVLVRMLPNWNNGADVAPATITRVWSQADDGSWTINVRVLADGETVEWRTSISLYLDQAAADEAKPDGTSAGWWPPRS